MKCGIYEIICIVNEKRYIGSSKNINDRFKRHISSLRKGSNPAKYLQESFNEFGEDNFSFRIIEEIEEDNLGERERHWIICLNTVFPNGFNGSLGGETGLRSKSLSEDAKIKMSKRNAGKGNPNYGNKWTQSMKDNASIRLKGNGKDIPKSHEHKENISKSGKGKHNHVGENNPKSKVTREMFLKIKNEIIDIKDNYKMYEVENIVSKKYNISNVTVRRIIYGNHHFSSSLGCLKDWDKALDNSKK